MFKVVIPVPEGQFQVRLGQCSRFTASGGASVYGEGFRQEQKLKTILATIGDILCHFSQ
jgi:hypothetical protein